ncbi:MAG: methyltransferase domain-containing protein [Propionibacteriaceae bacterium]
MVPVHTLVRPDVYPRSSTYDPDWVLSLDMGPHPLWQLEGLLPALQLHRGDRVLDLGCGRGATSVFLAREAGVDVVAFDQWVRAADVQEVIDAAGVTGNVTVVNGDARQLPFGDAEFDAIVSVDAFEYFGTDVRFLPSLLRVLRSGGAVAMSTPALSVDPYLRPPPAQVTALVGWEAAAWHTPEWWRTHWELTGMLTGVNAELQPGSRDDWILWAKASGDDGGPLLEMLTSMAADEIGFALVSAAKE